MAFVWLLFDSLIPTLFLVGDFGSNEDDFQCNRDFPSLRKHKSINSGFVLLHGLDFRIDVQLISTDFSFEKHFSVSFFRKKAIKITRCTHSLAE